MTPTVRNSILSAIVGCLMTLGGCALHEDLGQFSYESGTDANSNNLNNMQDAATDLRVSNDMAEDMADPIDTGLDMTLADMPDAEADMTQVDMTADMNQVDMAADTGNPANTCPGVDTSPIEGNCDPVNDTTCPNGFACAIVLTSGPPDVEFGTGCLQIDNPEPWTQMTGEACSASRCVAGNQCVSDVCRAYCRLANAEGCANDEFCEQINTETSEYGVCVPACN